MANIWEGSMYKQVWKGIENDDNDSYISTDHGPMNDSADSDSDDDFI